MRCCIFCVFREWLHVRPVAGMPPAICCSVRMVSFGSLTFFWLDGALLASYETGYAVMVGIASVCLV